MKKLSYLAAAFVLGLLLSVTINACGGDKENVGPNGSSGGTTGVGGCEISNWGFPKLSSSEEYDESGQLKSHMEDKYNEKGWLVEQKLTIFMKSQVTEKYYKYWFVTTNYTYSQNGDYRTGIKVSTTYNEDGSVQSIERTTSKEYVYQQ